MDKLLTLEEVAEILFDKFIETYSTKSYDNDNIKTLPKDSVRTY